jgi:Protein of unknown function (DUF3306)
MSEREDFLARWSHRKRQMANQVENAPIAAEPDASAQRMERKSLDNERLPETEPTEPLFDPTTLPTVESISAETDIRAFLAPGVPAELTRAALRRAWAADPTIRDFVGLADYAWDFHAPGAMPGFGPMEMTDALRREVVAMLTRNEPRPGSSDNPSGPRENVEQTHGEGGLDRTSIGGEIKSAEAFGRRDETTSVQNMKLNRGNDVAAQYQPSGPDQAHSPLPRRHGSALPKA